MQLSISTQHINKLGDSLQTYVKEKSSEVIKKYLEDVVSIAVHFTKQRADYNCSIVVIRGMAKQTLKSDDNAHDIYASFDRAVAKLETQLRKYKSKLKNHHKDKIKPSTIENLGTKYIINPYKSPEHEESHDNLDDNPLIIAEKPLDIERLTVSEAVMKMDLENLPALLFIHDKTKRVNVVYYRKDGNISWIDSNNIS